MISNGDVQQIVASTKWVWKEIFEFLAGLNKELDEVQGCILGKEPLPSNREVFAEVHREESLQIVMIGNPSPLVAENSVLVSKGLDTNLTGGWEIQRNETWFGVITATDPSTLWDSPEIAWKMNKLKEL